MKRLFPLAMLAAACGVAPPDGGADGPFEAASPLAGIAAAGEGPWASARWTGTHCALQGGAWCLDNVNHAEQVLEPSVLRGLDADFGLRLPRRVNLSDGIVANRADDVALVQLVGSNLADRVALSFSGYVKVPPGNAPNTWSFAVGSDDGYRLRLHDGSQARVDEHVAARTFAFGNNGAGAALNVTFPASGGLFPFELVFFDRTATAGLELVMRQGTHASYNAEPNLWSLVPLESLYGPDLRVTMSAEKIGSGPVASGDSIRWTVVLRNAGQTPVYPVTGGTFPGPVSGTGIVFSNCLSPGLTWKGFGPTPPGTTTLTTAGTECPQVRGHAFVTQPIAAGDAVQLDYTTTITGLPGQQICDQAYGFASTTEIPGIGKGRISRLSDDPSGGDARDAANAPASLLGPSGFADDDETCVRIGEILPPFAITKPAPGAVLMARRPELAGTAKPGAAVSVRLSGPASASCDATSDAQGVWRCTAPVDLADGAWTAEAHVVDAAANEGPRATRPFTVAVATPAKPTLQPVATPSLDTTPTFRGVAPGASGADVVAEDGTVLCTSIVSPSQQFGCTSAPLAQGTWVVRAFGRDALGRQSPGSDPLTFVIDLAGPEAPSLSSPSAIVNDPRPLFAGSSEPGALVRITEAGAELCSDVADATGAFDCRPAAALAQGMHAVLAIAVDELGNGGAATSRSFLLDSIAPGRPELTPPGAAIRERQPLFEGFRESGTVVRVRARGADGLLGPALCTSPSGGVTWSCRPASPLADGRHLVAAEAEDAAGNASEPCPTLEGCPNERSFVVDAIAPPAPTLDAFASPTRAVPPLAGTAESGSRVRVREGSLTICDVVASNGRFTCPARAFADGRHSLAATSEDAAGNVSPEAALAFIVDLTPPAAPVLDALASVREARPVISGRAEPGARVVVKEGTSAICEATAGADGRFSCAPGTPLADGPHALRAFATDAAGNTSAPSAAISFAIDARAPDAPRLDVVQTPTRSPHIRLGGTAEPATLVRVFAGALVLCEVTAAFDGRFACEPAGPFPDGAHELVARARDAAGNVSDASEPIRFVVDTRAPAAPAIDAPVSPTRARTPALTGTAEPGAQVHVEIGARSICGATTDAAGRWTCVIATALDDGAHVLTARATDEAGNTSPASTPVVLGIDTIAPPPPVLDTPRGITPDRRPVFSGRAEPDSEVTLREGGGLVCRARAGEDGRFACTALEELRDGAHHTDAVATDRAGNESASAAFTWTLGPLPIPPRPEITSPAEGELLERLVEIRGRATGATRVELHLDGEALASTTVVDGAWRFVPTAGFELAPGTHSLRATAVDGAGTRSADSDEVSFELLSGGTLVGGGCACDQGGAHALALLLVPLVARRRRARR